MAGIWFGVRPTAHMLNFGIYTSCEDRGFEKGHDERNTVSDQPFRFLSLEGGEAKAFYIGRVNSSRVSDAKAKGAHQLGEFGGNSACWSPITTQPPPTEMILSANSQTIGVWQIKMASFSESRLAVWRHLPTMHF